MAGPDAGVKKKGIVNQPPDDGLAPFEPDKVHALVPSVEIADVRDDTLQPSFVKGDSEMEKAFLYEISRFLHDSSSPGGIRIGVTPFLVARFASRQEGPARLIASLGKKSVDLNETDRALTKRASHTKISIKFEFLL
jgi:hypothetical protein